MSITRYHSTWDNMKDDFSIHEHQADPEVSQKYHFPQTRNNETLHIKTKQDSNEQKSICNNKPPTSALGQ